MSDATRMQAKRLRLLLRDYRMLEAGLALPAGQSLLSFLAGRKTYLTLHDAAWVATGERIESVAIRTDRILWIAIVDDDLPLVNGRVTAEPRGVEVLLEGGLLLSGGLSLAPVQRVPDYLESAGPFIAMRDATLIRGGRPAHALDLDIGDVALNHEAVQAAWEAAGREPDSQDETSADTSAFPDVTISFDDETPSPDASFDDAIEPSAPLYGFEGSPVLDLADGDSGAEVGSLLEPAVDVDGAAGDALAEVDFGFTADLSEDDPETGAPSGVMLGLDEAGIADEVDQDDEPARPTVHRSEGWV